MLEAIGLKPMPRHLFEDQILAYTPFQNVTQSNKYTLYENTLFWKQKGCSPCLYTLKVKYDPDAL